MFSEMKVNAQFFALGLALFAAQAQAVSVTLQGSSTFGAGSINGVDVTSNPGQILLSQAAWITPTTASYSPRYIRNIQIAYPTGIPGNPTLNGVPVFVDIPNLYSLTSTGKLDLYNNDMVVEGTGYGSFYPGWADLPGQDTRRIMFNVYGLTPSGLTLRLYYGDNSFGSLSFTSKLSILESTNSTWKFNGFHPMPTSVGEVSFQPLSNTGSKGWVGAYPTMTGPANTVSVSVTNAASAEVFGYLGYSLKVPLGISSVTFGYQNYVRNQTSYTDINTGITGYPRFHVVAPGLSNPLNFDNTGAGLIFSAPTCGSPCSANQAVSTFIAGPNNGQALTSQFVNEVGWIYAMRDQVNTGPPAYEVTATTLTFTSDAIVNLRFTLLPPTLGIATPVTPTLGVENGRYPSEGFWESGIIDLGDRPNGQGKLDVSGTIPAQTMVHFAVATSSDGVNFSPFPAYRIYGDNIYTQNERYIKVRLKLTSETNDQTPSVQSVTITYSDTEPAIKIYNYPNPCYPNKGQHCVIAGIPTVRAAKVEILDTSGQLVRTLDKPAEYVAFGPLLKAVWDGRNGSGNLVAPGLYLYRVIDKDKKLIGKGKILAYNY